MWRCEEGSLQRGYAAQYTGTAGRIENAQVAVYLTEAGPAGHAMIDRELYLPRSWVNDSARCDRRRSTRRGRVSRPHQRWPGR